MALVVAAVRRMAPVTLAPVALVVLVVLVARVAMVSRRL